MAGAVHNDTQRFKEEMTDHLVKGLKIRIDYIKYVLESVLSSPQQQQCKILSSVLECRGPMEKKALCFLKVVWESYGTEV
jgi:hypothetical protein